MNLSKFSTASTVTSMALACLACGSEVPISAASASASADTPDAAAPPQSSPPTYTTLVGGTVPVGPGVQVGYALTATAPMTYQFRWTGDARVAHDGYQEFTGSIWTAGHFFSLVPGCVDQLCPLEAGDYVSSVEQVAGGGERIEWDTFAAGGWDGFGFVTDTEPVYLDVLIDGDRHPELFFFASSPSGEANNPTTSPFGVSSAP